MDKIISNSVQETRQNLKEGVDIIANAVKATLGPKGRNVVIETMYGTPHITKDGVTVAKAIDLKAPVQNLAAQIIKQAAAKTVQQAGDGTTTAIVLAQAIYNEGYKLIQTGVTTPIELKRSIDKIVPSILQTLKEMSIPITGDSVKIQQVASISANNDEEIGKLIASAFEAVGEHGVVHVEEAKMTDTYVEMTQGAKIDRGYVSPYFITNPAKLTCELDNPLILLYDKKLRAAQDIVPALTLAAKQNRPLLVVAEEIESQALSLLIVNKMRGIQVAAVRAPAFGERRGKVLEDLAILTGAELISESKGRSLDKVSNSDFGQAAKVIISRNDTTIIKGAGKPELITKRIQDIIAETEITESGYEVEKNKERVAMLAGKAAVLYVGAATEIELKQKKDRVDDAIQATQAALKHGIVPGGGTVFLQISSELEAYNEVGHKVLANALKAPIVCICQNAEVVPGVVIFNILENGYKGYNANTNKYGDMIEEGIIDPTLVLIVALENAVSVATMLLLTEVTITNNPKSVIQDNPSMEDQYPDEMM